MRKRILLLLPLISLLLSLFCACKKEAGDYVKEINSAIEKGDFKKAYELYDVMAAGNPHRDVPLHRDLEEEYDRVAENMKVSIIKNEITTTIKDSENASDVAKIVYIIETRGGNESGLYEFAIKIAKANGKTEIAKGLTEINN